jgi:glucosamine--fructose-6-phosphate aminotransferase (isomerizing)
MSLIDEIYEQPQVLSRLYSTQLEKTTKIAKNIKAWDPNFVFIAARGTSDNAGRYANYLLGAYNQLPLALATPSLFTYYNLPPRLNHALVVGISQSGQSPDIVRVLEEGRRQGCQTMAITNAVESPLADQSDYVIDIMAGTEKAVAASKSYTAELMAIAMLSVCLADDAQRKAELERVPEWVAQTLELNNFIAESVLRYRYMEQCIVIGRGFNYSTAFEWSLKIKELTYVMADPYSSADFLHGPIALVGKGFPVLAVVPDGKVFDTLKDLLTHLKNDMQAELMVISDRQDALDLATVPVKLPAGIPEWLTPIVSIVPGQLFAYHLTRAKGLNTEAPRSIHKITETH